VGDEILARLATQTISLVKTKSHEHGGIFIKGKIILILIVLVALCAPTTAYSGKVDFPELFKYSEQKSANLETALLSISHSFKDNSVPVTQELLAAIMATLDKEVGGSYLPVEEQGDYGMGPSSTYTVGGSRRSTPYDGGIDYKGRGYIQITGKGNYQTYCGLDCIGTSSPELDVCGCKNQWQCTATDASTCPQVKALQTDYAARIFVSYYVKNGLVSLSNAENYNAVGKAINGGAVYASDFNAIANAYLMLFSNNPDKTNSLITWLNSGASTPTPMAVDVYSLGIPQEDQNRDVTLTLYVHDGSASGPLIPGAQVTSQDGSGNSFQKTTDSNGYVTITGDPGTWSFSASADGYVTNSWDQEITENDTRDAFLQKVQAPSQTETKESAPVTLTLYVHEGRADGPKLSGAEVRGQDSAGNSFSQITDENGFVVITGSPGNWQFTATKLGYDVNSWSQKITETGTKHAYLFAERMPTISSIENDVQSTTQNVGSGSEASADSEVGDLINALKDNDAEVRKKAAESLGKLADTRGVDPLIEALRYDENGDVREMAAWALGQIDDARTIDALSYASVKDAEGYVRVEAYDALQKSTVGGNKVDARSVDPIIGALKDEDQGVRYRAAEALGQLKNATAVDALIEALNDEDGDVREMAAWALGQIDDAGTVDPLSYASVKDAEGYVRDEAYNALQKSTVGGNKVDARSVDPIIGALKDEDQGVRYRAAEALGQLKNATALDALIEALNDEDGDVREMAAWALGEIGDVQAVDPLNYASVKDAEGYVRDEAKKALGKLGVQVE
jgi:HEAT repeat protein